MTSLRISILLLLLCSTAQPVLAAKNGLADLELRQPNTTNSIISAQVGEIVEVEVFMRGRGEQTTGVQIFFSFDDTFLELVSLGQTNNGPKPFVPGGYISGSIFRNDSMDDKIGDSSANKLPGYQMLYQEQVSGFGGQVARVGDGTIARFSLRIIRKPGGGSVTVRVDPSSPIGSKTGYFIVSDPGTTYSYRNITNLRFNIHGISNDILNYISHWC